MFRLISAALCALLSLAAPVFGQEPSADPAQSFVDSLQFRDGEIPLAQANARFRLDAGFRFLEQADARRVLEEFWGNPPDDSVLGLIVPREPSLASDESWAVVVTFNEEGFVSDADANEIDYDEMLVSMKEATAADNEAREAAGYGRLALIGWAEPPRYEAASKKIYWARELAFGDNEQHTLNYDIRVLGRYGYLSLNAVSNMAQMGQVRDGMQSLLGMTEFDSGHRYADFDDSTDQVATYGLAALIGGGVAAKTGFFGKLLALLIAGKKIVIPLLVGAVALIARLFKGKPKQA